MSAETIGKEYQQERRDRHTSKLFIIVIIMLVVVAVVGFFIVNKDNQELSPKNQSSQHDNPTIEYHTQSKAK